MCRAKTSGFRWNTGISLRMAGRRAWRHRYRCGSARGTFWRWALGWPQGARRCRGRYGASRSSRPERSNRRGQRRQRMSGRARRRMETSSAGRMGPAEVVVKGMGRAGQAGCSCRWTAWAPGSEPQASTGTGSSESATEAWERGMGATRQATDSQSGRLLPVDRAAASFCS